MWHAHVAHGPHTPRERLPHSPARTWPRTLPGESHPHSTPAHCQGKLPALPVRAHACSSPHARRLQQLPEDARRDVPARPHQLPATRQQEELEQGPRAEGRWPALCLRRRGGPGRPQGGGRRRRQEEGRQGDRHLVMIVGLINAPGALGLARPRESELCWLCAAPV
eukprot:3873664-Prymnesium_polylepis.1